MIVLTYGTWIPDVSARYLNGLNPDFTAPNGTAIVTAGGPGDIALRDALLDGKLPNWPAQVRYFPLVGQNEKDTALLIARRFFSTPGTAAVATNRTWFDALTGGAMIGFRHGPLLITDPTGLYAGVGTYLAENAGSIWTGVLLGGPAALPAALQAPIGDAIGLPGQWVYTSVTASTASVGQRGVPETTHAEPDLNRHTPTTITR